MRTEYVNGILVATDEPALCRVCGGPRTDDAYERQTGCDTCGYIESDCICKPCAVCGFAHAGAPCEEDA